MKGAFMSRNTDRSAYWDIVKGFAIIAVVMGHCGIMTAFVYLFHLAVFFFVTGYFYNENKYGDDPFRYFGKRLSGCWPRFFFYTVCCVLVHNFFVTRGLYANTALYNHTAMLTSILHGAAMQCTETMQGALWFVPAWLLTSACFSGIIWFGRTAARRLGPAWIEPAATAFGILAAGITGLFLYDRQCYLPYNLHCAILVIPLYYAAWMMRRHLPSFKRYATWYGALISAVLLYLVNTRLYIFIDISAMSIPGVRYYPVSLLGIYLVLSLSAIAERIPCLSRGLAFLGRYSFDIMALHFLVFKLTDLVYARFAAVSATAENLAGFPVGFRGELEPVYLVLGVLLPALTGWAVDRTAHFLLPEKQLLSKQSHSSTVNQA